MSARPSELLDALVTDAVDSLQGADCGAPVCAADRDNRPVAGVKHSEGRWAALRGVQREVGRGTALDQALDTATSRWRADLAQHVQRASGRDWIAYCTGGVEALEELAEAQRS